MRFALCITTATDTHSEYVILIVFPQQQWLRERACVTSYLHFQACYKTIRALQEKFVSELLHNYNIESTDDMATLCQSKLTDYSNSFSAHPMRLRYEPLRCQVPCNSSGFWSARSHRKQETPHWRFRAQCLAYVPQFCMMYSATGIPLMLAWGRRLVAKRTHVVHFRKPETDRNDTNVTVKVWNFY